MFDQLLPGAVSQSYVVHDCLYAESTQQTVIPMYSTRFFDVSFGFISYRLHVSVWLRKHSGCLAASPTALAACYSDVSLAFVALISSPMA